MRAALHRLGAARIIVGLGVVLAFALGVVDAAFDAWVLGDGTFAHQLFHPTAAELWNRLLIGVVTLALMLVLARNSRAEEALRLFSQAVEEAPDAIQVVAIDGTVLHANHAMKRLLGYTPKELEGVSVKVLHADPAMAEAMLPEIASRGRWSDEVVLRHKDGHTVPTWLSVAKVHGARGEPLAMVGVVRDLTERRQAAEALEESEQRFRRVFEQGPLGMSIVDLERRFVRVNAAYCQMTGFTEEELVGRSFDAITHPEDRIDGEAAIARLFDGEVPAFVREKRYVRKDGSLMWIRLTASVLQGNDGKARYGLKMIEDITEQRRANEALREAKERAEAADRTKSEFLDIASHELRTPLTALCLGVELARKRVASGRPVDSAMLEKVERQTWRLTQMVEDLLDASRLERGQIAIRPTPTDLGKLVSSTVEDFRARATGKAIRVTLADGSAPVVADPARIEQVLANLLDNAVKYSPDDAPVEVGLTRRDDRFEVSVADSGPGIREEHQARLFTRFYRAPSDLARYRAGLGLGLFICRMIIEAHHGDIGVESRPGKGSRFYFTLPAQG